MRERLFSSKEVRETGEEGKNSHHTSYDADGIKQHNRCGSYYPITTDQAFVQNQTPNNGTLAVAEDESKVKKVITCLQSRPHFANINVGTSTVSIHLANLEQLDQYIFNGKPQIDSKTNRNPPRNGLPQKLGRAKVLKEEPDDFTGQLVAPNAVDACIPLDESAPLFGEMLVGLMGSYGSLLPDDINSLDSSVVNEQQANKSNNNNSALYQQAAVAAPSESIINPANSPEGSSSLPSLCSPNSLSQEDDFPYYTMNVDDMDDLTMRAPYIPMNEQDDLPLLTSDEFMCLANRGVNSASVNGNDGGGNGDDGSSGVVAGSGDGGSSSSNDGGTNMNCSVGSSGNNIDGRTFNGVREQQQLQQQCLQQLQEQLQQTQHEQQLQQQQLISNLNINSKKEKFNTTLTTAPILYDTIEDTFENIYEKNCKYKRVERQHYTEQKNENKQK
uniref:Uncharacterized protein n=1 Tax=Glossina palpalis gambiensis TaxID=67801 RepID=A0A1B0BRW3_9MUSC